MRSARLRALIRKFYNVIYTNCMKMIHRRGTENAEKSVNFRLSLRRRQTKTFMPPAGLSAFGSLLTNKYSPKGMGLFLFALLREKE